MGAFKATVNKGSSVTDVVFEECRAFNTGRWPVFKIKGCKNVEVRNCDVKGSDAKYTIVAVCNNGITFKGNAFHVNNRLTYTEKNIEFVSNKISR